MPTINCQVSKGGSWIYRYWESRCSTNSISSDSSQFFYIGFRLIKEG